MDNQNDQPEKQVDKKQLSKNQQGSLTNLYNVNLTKVQNSKLFQKFLDQERHQINKVEEKSIEQQLQQTSPNKKIQQPIVKKQIVEKEEKIQKQQEEQYQQQEQKQQQQQQYSAARQTIQKSPPKNEQGQISVQFQQPIQLSPYTQKLSPENKRLIKLQKTNQSREKKQITNNSNNNISAQKPLNFNDLVCDDEDQELQGYSEIIGNPYTQSMIKQQQQLQQPQSKQQQQQSAVPQYLYPLAQPQNYQQAQEILLLKQTIQEQIQEIQKLKDIIKMDENQELQVNNSLFIANQTIEDLKGKLAMNKDKASNEYFSYEERLSLQNQKLYELQKTEDELRAEIDDLRRKILKEINEKNQFQNMLHEATQKNEEFNEIIREKDNLLYRKNDELFLVKKEFDAQKFQLQSLGDYNSKYQERLQKQEQLTQSQQFELETKQNQINQLLSENHGNKLEIEQKNQSLQSFNLQLKNQQNELESKNIELENQNFRKQKQQQNEINQQLELEKAYLEISSLRQELQKAQYSLESEKSKNFSLIQKLSQIAEQRVQQWEQPKQQTFPNYPYFPEPINIPTYELDYKAYQPIAPPSRASNNSINFEPKLQYQSQQLQQQELRTPKQQRSQREFDNIEMQVKGGRNAGKSQMNRFEVNNSSNNNKINNNNQVLNEVSIFKKYYFFKGKTNNIIKSNNMK